MPGSTIPHCSAISSSLSRLRLESWVMDTGGNACVCYAALRVAGVFEEEASPSLSSCPRGSWVCSGAMSGWS
jgi:hypothetical protein